MTTALQARSYIYLHSVMLLMYSTRAARRSTMSHPVTHLLESTSSDSNRRQKRFSVRSRYSTPTCLVLNQRGEPGRVLIVCGGGGVNPRTLLGRTCFCVDMQPMQKKNKNQTKTKSGGSSPREGEYHTALVTTGSTGQRTGNVTRTSAQLLRRTARRSLV